MDRRRTAILAIGVVLLAVVAATVTYLVWPGSTSPGPSRSYSGPALCPTSGPNGTVGNWTTYHGGPTRSGYLAAPAISTAAPTWTAPIPLNGQVYAEPLVCGNAVFVATEEDSVYAINATTGAILWQTNLGTPVPGSALPCGDINPSGITGTPAIDTATGTLYVVAFLSSVHHMLYGLSVVNGSIRSQVPIDPPGDSPSTEQQRGALAIANGYVYVPFGGLFGDCGQYHGWVVGAPLNGSADLISYMVPTTREAAIWGVAGEAVSPNGSLYVATGNGASNSVYDFGDSVIELSPTLHEIDSFAPANWVELNEHDQDLGSVAPTLLPNGDVFQIGKEGVGYLLDGDHLGGINGQLGEEPICAGAYGGTAQVGLSVFVPCTNGLFDVAIGPTNVSVTWSSPNFDAGTPVVTGDIVWAVNISSSVLMGFSVAHGTPMYAFPLAGDDHFISPTAAPGRLFVAGGTELYSFTVD
ncbi:MAG TPA: PQQ-binding-like beta-propeller repeat protein [Thermoplasmata archaeon]|nr:PQQ-binding-like beta-propeller repeat protein [Thermoplasmata archaeon]